MYNRQQWLAGVKAGDEVAVWRTIRRVVKRTPKRITLDDGTSFDENGCGLGVAGRTRQRSAMEIRPANLARADLAREKISRAIPAYGPCDVPVDVLIFMGHLIDGTVPWTSEEIEQVRAMLRAAESAK